MNPTFDTNTLNNNNGLKLAVEAIRSNDKVMMQRALQQLSDINVRDENRNTLLVLVVHAKRYGLTRILLDAGADINVMGRHNRTPISFAAEAKSIKVLNLLLQRGGDPNLRAIGDFYNGRPPIHGAADSNSPKCIELLLAYGADINARDEEWQRTALHVSLDAYPALLAARYLILHGADIHARDKTGSTPLQEAIGSGAHSIIALLRQKGAFM